MTSDAPLSQLLRTATRPQHEHAETRSFVTDLMSGALGESGRAGYTALTRQHHAVYSALEAKGAELRGDAVAAPLVLDELLRVPSLEADLEVLHGENWREEIELLPATRDYVAALERIESPAQYLAHAYTRYLGDLSGGQIISRMMQRHYGLAESELSFYEFAAIPKSKPFKDDFRDLMDAAPFSAEEKERVVAEAMVAFDLNAALFVQLGELFPGSEDATAA